MESKNGTISKPIQIEKAIVGFIDILGYESLVQRLQDNIYIISWFEKLIMDRVINYPQRLDKEVQLGNSVLEEYRSKIIEAINMKAISDTILFTLYLDRLDFKSPEGISHDPITDAIWTYFRMIEMFCIYFIAKTGHIFRGGISVGKHYESNFDSPGNLFIFSNSYINAFRAEKTAKDSRIIIDKELSDYLRLFTKFDYIKEHLYEDLDGMQCVDIYSFLEKKDTSKIILKDIKNGVTANFNFNKNDKKALIKLIYFANYHNMYLTKNNWDDHDLYFDTEEFEKILSGISG